MMQQLQNSIDYMYILKFDRYNNYCPTINAIKNDQLKK